VDLAPDRAFARRGEHERCSGGVLDGDAYGLLQGDLVSGAPSRLRSGNELAELGMDA
jgi:hypothetical protein